MHRCSISSSLVRIFLSLLVISGGLQAVDFLEDATLLVAPGEDPASGLVALPGMAVVTIKAKSDYLSNVIYEPVDGTVLTKFIDKTGPCENDTAWTTWRWNVASAKTNADVSAITTGLVVRCTGIGDTPPPFKGRIVNVDLDADTDNTSDPVVGQKRPDQSDSEDQTEWPVDADADKNPGLVLIVNHGFEEDGYGDGSSPIEDWKKDGIKTDDIDLSQSILTITGGRHGVLKLTYDITKLKIYRDTGSSSAELWRPAQEISLDPGTYHLLFEGIAAGKSPIIADFYPDQGTGQPAEDLIKVTVLDLQLQVDRNRDGSVTGVDSDLTRTKDPLVFWFNNNSDGKNTTNRPGRPDYLRGTFAGYIRGGGRGGSGGRNYTLRRDLEDFQRMVSMADGPGLATAVREERMRLAVGFMPTPAITHVIKVALWQNPDADATMDYLKSVSTADAWCTNTKLVARTEESGWQKISKKRLLFPGGDVVRGSYLWDANGDVERTANPEDETVKKPGEGQLGLVLQDAEGKILAVNRHLHLKLGDFRYFYEHFSAGDRESFPSELPPPVVTGSLKTKDTGPDLSAGGEVALALPPKVAKKSNLVGTDQLFLFVHGYRMQTWERRAFAENAFKRLYWQGWNGKFAFFSWPTEYVSDGVLPLDFYPQNYDRSEFQARRCGTQALTLILDLMAARYTSKNITLMAHSMGNVVLSEALRLREGKVAENYFAMQSAEVSGAYTKIAAPPLLLNDFVARRAYDSTYTPDLCGFSSPRSPRALVTWAEWDQNFRPAGEILLRGELVVDPIRRGHNAWESYRLSHPADGAPYHLAIIERNVVPQRFAYFNGSDPATSSAWNYVQLSRPDIGFTYEPQLAAPRPVDGNLGLFSLYRDSFRINTRRLAGRNYAQMAPFNGLPIDNGSQSNGTDRLLEWSPSAIDGNGLIARAAILALATKSWTQAVGAIDTEDSTRPGAALGIFSGTIDTTEEFKISGGSYDHSAFFVYSIQRMWEGWASVRAHLPVSQP